MFELNCYFHKSFHLSYDFQQIKVLKSLEFKENEQFQSKRFNPSSLITLVQATPEQINYLRAQKTLSSCLRQNLNFV